MLRIDILRSTALALLAVFGLLAVACSAEDNRTSISEHEVYQLRRQAMVKQHIAGRGIGDSAVLAAMGSVPRHLFVPTAYREGAYGDFPLPIEHGQTISQPYIVAAMTELLKPDSTSRILEVGTGSGYQAAILAEIVDSVFTIEIVAPLAVRAEELLDSLGYDNIVVKAGDGFAGWPEHAPFDGVIVTCAPSNVPRPLVEQLAEGGRMVIPVGDITQELVVLTKHTDSLVREVAFPVRFVPMTGEAQTDSARFDSTTSK
ncbi:protein-L-isoaspartate(D-aspartate) O-methyltransferase [candidate division GN15 bacterium]|nr:protein-L-isoaspartate(D-aspartate) O-methyltransferase [candidate division GN15 bacterium]